MSVNKLTSKIIKLILRGEIDPLKVKDIEKMAGVKLNLSAEQLAWGALVYANRQEFRN